MNLLKIGLLLACLSGCNSWPSHGEGGVAESHAPERWLFSEREEAFLHELALLEADTRQLAQFGGQDCQPAQVLEARRALVRAKRDFYGQMQADAERSMKHVRIAVGRLHWNQEQLGDCYRRRAHYELAR